MKELLIDFYNNYMNGNTVALLLFLIGIYGLLARRNIIKAVVSFGIIQSSIILFFISSHYETGKRPPIGLMENQVDPLPQALMITAIVIGAAITAIGLTMFINLYHHYGTTNWKKVITKRKEES